MLIVAQIIAFTIIIILGILIFRKWPVKFKTAPLVQVSMFLVIALVLSYFSIMLGVIGFPALKIGFATIPLMLIGLVYGPGWGFIGGVLYDVLGLMVTPTDLPFLGFTLGNILVCTLPGIVSSKIGELRLDKLRRIVACLLVVFSTILIMLIWVFPQFTTSLKLNDLHRVVVTIIAVVYPIVFWFVMQLVEKETQNADAKDVTKIFLSTILIEGGVNLLLNPLWLYIMYDIPYLISYSLRAVKILIMIPLDVIVILMVYKTIKKILGGKNNG